MASILFKEKQRYRDIPTLLFLGVLTVSASFGALKFLVQSEKNYSNSIFLFSMALLFGALIWWLSRLQLKVTISKKKIKYKLSPLHPKKRIIPWKEVDKCEVVKTPAAAQWSGGNISFNWEKGISLTGRNGLALKTKKGEYYFIGCQNVEELEETLNEMEVKQ